MKKIATYILLTLTITLFAMQISTANAGTLIAQEDGEYVQSITPKPDYLPGPSEEEQSGEDATRNLLIDTVLPRFAIGMIGFVGSLSLLFLVISGVRFAMAYGNEETIKKAKDQAIYALIGLIIALLSYTIVRVVTNIELEGDTTEQIETSEDTDIPVEPGEEEGIGIADPVPEV